MVIHGSRCNLDSQPGISSCFDNAHRHQQQQQLQHHHHLQYHQQHSRTIISISSTSISINSIIMSFRFRRDRVRVTNTRYDTHYWKNYYGSVRLLLFLCEQSNGTRSEMKLHLHYCYARLRIAVVLRITK